VRWPWKGRLGLSIFTCWLTMSLAGCGTGQLTSPASELPEISLTNLSGQEVPLASYRGKVLLVDFWATWCAPCEEAIPELIELQERYGERGLQVVGIALDVGGAKVVAPYVKDHDMTYPIFLGDDTTTRAFGGIMGVPTSFLIDRDGRIVKRFVGVVDHKNYEDLIRGLL
jgi:thiol-disulfide isomerase/thioredoxin